LGAFEQLFKLLLNFFFQLKNFLRDILDKHGFEVRKSSHKRRRILSEEEERTEVPKEAPAWCIC